MSDTTDPTKISEDAQEIAETTGVAYKDMKQEQEDNAEAGMDFQDYDAQKVGTTLDENIDIKDSSSYVDEATMTVAGQMEKILGENSPYVSLNKKLAQEAAASRGLQNSTLAAYAGQKAAIESALPIAQQDAQTFAQFGQAKQSADYNLQTIQSEAIISGEMVEQKGAIDRKNQDINNAFQAALAGANAQNQVWLADLQNTYNIGMENLMSLNKQILLGEEMDYQVKMNVAEQAASIMQNYQVTVENWMSDPDFLALGKEAVNNGIAQMQNLAANVIGFIGASQDVPMDEFIEKYLLELNVYQ